jgi:hypothetical protein
MKYIGTQEDFATEFTYFRNKAFRLFKENVVGQEATEPLREDVQNMLTNLFFEAFGNKFDPPPLKVVDVRIVNSHTINIQLAPAVQEVFIEFDVDGKINEE